MSSLWAFTAGRHLHQLAELYEVSCCTAGFILGFYPFSWDIRMT
jgi:hypothetical protein